MLDKPRKSPDGNDQEARRIEVRLSPDTTRNYLLISLKRTRLRAARLLAELLRIARQPEPDLDRVRQLAEGIQFESELARETSQALADLGPRSGLAFDLAF